MDGRWNLCQSKGTVRVGSARPGPCLQSGGSSKLPQYRAVRFWLQPEPWVLHHMFICGILTLLSAPTRSLPSPPPSSPAGNYNNATSQPFSSGMFSVHSCYLSARHDGLCVGSTLRKRSLASQDNLRGKRARHSSPVEGNSLFVYDRLIKLMAVFY